jgi:hypothetical protein
MHISQDKKQAALVGWVGFGGHPDLLYLNSFPSPLRNVSFELASLVGVYMYIYTHEGIQSHEGLGQLGQSEIDQAIKAAKRQWKIHLDRQKRYIAGKNITASLKEEAKAWKWFAEGVFLEGLKAVYESQAGVPLNYRNYPVTKVDPKVDPKTGKPGKDNPWRLSTKRQNFSQLEANGSFCLGASRAMAFRTLFGLDKPIYRQVLTELKKGIEAAKASGDIVTEATLIISRIVSHKHDPGSLKQFNLDLASRYGIKNVIVRNASRKEAEDALKQGAPIIAGLKGYDPGHWVLVQKSPRGQYWANDPILDKGVRKISLSEFDGRFELIVDATTDDLITPNEAGKYKK